MNKISSFAIVILIAATLACQAIIPKPTQLKTSDMGCLETIASVNNLLSDSRFPQHFSEENPAKQGGEFDPNRYFEAFTHLRMQDGFVLDYVYHQDGMGGYPVLYARLVDQSPFATEADYLAAVPEQPDYLSFVVPEDNPEGYFEYAAFAIIANQFYLSWHANYNDWRVLCNSDEIEAIIQSLDNEDAFGLPMTAKQKRQARAIDNPQPLVELGDETAVVRLLVFTKWGGFYQREFTIRRAGHFILDVQDTPLVEYDCGIMF